MIEKFVNYNSEFQPKKETNELFVNDIHELMEYYLHTVEEKIGKTASKMNKAEKLCALDFLDQKGMLQISKSSIKFCEFFQNSKFTLYNYLDEIRGNIEKDNK